MAGRKFLNSEVENKQLNIPETEKYEEHTVKNKPYTVGTKWKKKQSLSKHSYHSE